MAVSFKTKKYVNKKSTSNGYFYAKAITLGEINLDGIAEKIQQNCSLKKSDVKACLTELVEVMTESLQDGKKVRINGLGSFKIGVKATLQEDAKKVTAESIKGFRVNFLPEYRIEANGDRTVALTSGARARVYDEYNTGVNDKDMNQD